MTINIKNNRDETFNGDITFLGSVTLSDGAMTVPAGGDVEANDVDVANDITIAEAGNVIVGSTTGSKIGTATTQKLAFHNSTPVVQRAGAAQAAVAATAATDTTPFGFAEAQANAIVTLLNEIRAVLVEKGLMKGAA